MYVFEFTDLTAEMIHGFAEVRHMGYMLLMFNYRVLLV